jgi:hypothetical protein
MDFSVECGLVLVTNIYWDLDDTCGGLTVASDSEKVERVKAWLASRMSDLEKWFVSDVERVLTARVSSPDRAHRIVVVVSLTNDPARSQLLILPCVGEDANCSHADGVESLTAMTSTAMKGGRDTVLWLFEARDVPQFCPRAGHTPGNRVIHCGL